ncbi:hypothetical protein [Mucilaginibacter phyllosphaerae]
MKKLFVYLFAVIAIMASACKGNTSSKTNDSAADSGQTHVGNSSPADSAKYPTSPTETGGKDSSGNGSGTTNAPKDTLKSNP